LSVSHAETPWLCGQPVAPGSSCYPVIIQTHIGGGLPTALAVCSHPT